MEFSVNQLVENQASIALLQIRLGRKGFSRNIKEVHRQTRFVDYRIVDERMILWEDVSIHELPFTETEERCIVGRVRVMVAPDGNVAHIDILVDCEVHLFVEFLLSVHCV